MAMVDWELEIQNKLIVVLRSIFSVDDTYQWTADAKTSKIQITSDFPATETPLLTPHIIVHSVSYSFPRPSDMGHLMGDVWQNGIVIGSEYRGNSPFQATISVLSELPVEARKLANLALNACTVTHPILFEEVGIQIIEGSGGGGAQPRATSPNKQFQANVALRGYFHWKLIVTPPGSAVMQKIRETLTLILH